MKDAFGVLRSEFIHVTMRYAASSYLVDFEVRQSFREAHEAEESSGM